MWVVGSCHLDRGHCEILTGTGSAKSRTDHGVKPHKPNTFLCWATSVHSSHVKHIIEDPRIDMHPTVIVSSMYLLGGMPRLSRAHDHILRPGLAHGAEEAGPQFRADLCPVL
jgi:hypothetical protein